MPNGNSVALCHCNIPVNGVTEQLCNLKLIPDLVSNMLTVNMLTVPTILLMQLNMLLYDPPRYLDDIPAPVAGMYKNTAKWQVLYRNQV